VSAVKTVRQATTSSHLDTKFDLSTVKAAGNTLLEEYTLELLPEQVEIEAGVASGGGRLRNSFAW
jgi:hypothetical protein